MKRLRQSVLIAVLLGMVAIPGHMAAAQPQPASPPAFSVGANPTAVAIDTATHTAYVTNGNDNTVSVVDVSHCRAGDTSGCAGSSATVTVGQGPVFAIVNQTTNTVYVANGAGNTVSIIDGATCNAAIHSTCGGAQPAVTVGTNPDYIAIDEATNTIYALNGNNGDQGSVSVIDGSHCDALVTSGCGGAFPSVPVGIGPFGLTLDPVNRTVYVSNTLGRGVAGTLSMIDTTSCNATDTSGCAQTPSAVAVPKGATWVDVDRSTDTVYVVGDTSARSLVSVIDGSSCNARTVTGCASAQPVLTVGSVSIGLVVDQATHSVFVANQEDNTVSVMDGSICNARATRGCDQTVPSVGVGFDPAHPGLDPSTGTLYVPIQNENSVDVLDAGACTLTHPSGCRHAAPVTAIGGEPSGIAIDNATSTVYVANRFDNNVSIINGATCNGVRLSGCGTPWPTVATDPSPQSLAVDEATRTLYTSNNSGTVSVIDISRCNASVLSGCGQTPRSVTINTMPDRLRSIAVDAAVHTVYVADQLANGLDMIDTTTCNGTNGSGCGTAPATVATGSFPEGVVIDQRTQTVYAANWHSATVSVIDATTCNAQVTSGCGGTHPSIPVGKRPDLMGFSSVTNTLYVANADSGTVSVIDATTCNAHNASGCGQTAASIAVSSPDVAQGTQSPFTVGVDEARDVLYIEDIVHSDIMVVDGATCNGKVTSSCNQPLALIPVGGWPTGLAIDPSLDSAYAPQNVDGTVSIVRLLHPHAGALGRTSIDRIGSQGSFTVWFDSASPGQGEILFGAGPGCSGMVETATQDSGAGTTSHAVQVLGNDLPGTVGDNGIQPGATYWYEAVTVTSSGTEIDNNGGKCYRVTVPNP